MSTLPYDASYLEREDTPLAGEEHVLMAGKKRIVIYKLLQANCERLFSTLGWFCGKRRNRLNIEKLESMAKVHQFISNTQEIILLL